MRPFNSRAFRAVLAASFLGFAPAADAALTLLFDAAFSGSAPAGAGPWLSATFTDRGAGSVRLAVSAGGLASPSNVSGLYFNLDPLLLPQDVSFAFDPLSSAPEASSIGRAADAWKADGDGRYDFLLSLPTGSGFDAGEALLYDLSSAAPGFGAASFAFQSEPAGGHGPFYAAAHVQNTPGGSAWIAPQSLTVVPLPGALGLLLAGAGAIAPFIRRARTRGALSSAAATPR